MELSVQVIFFLESSTQTGEIQFQSLGGKIASPSVEVNFKVIVSY